MGIQGIKPDVQTGASPANAIRASRTNTLHRQAVCKTANPSDLHAAQSCSSGDVHVRTSLADHTPLDMRAGTDTALARVIAVFGAAHPHHAYLFANKRANRIKVLVHDGSGI